MGTGGPSTGLKRGQGVTLTAHPHLVPRSRMNRNYTSSPPKHLHGVQRSRFTSVFLYVSLSAPFIVSKVITLLGVVLQAFHIKYTTCRKTVEDTGDSLGQNWHVTLVTAILERQASRASSGEWKSFMWKKEKWNTRPGYTSQLLFTVTLRSEPQWLDLLFTVTKINYLIYLWVVSLSSM
jgi:hypothetical protein